MCTNVNHNYGVPIDGIPPLLAVPLSGRVKIGIIDSKGEIQGQTTANQQGEWRSPFCLDDGEYTVEFRGNFRPIGTGFNALYNPPISSLSLSITVPLIPVDTTVEGATGAKGPRGISGPRGFSGRDGLAGSTGPVGAIGPEGQMGLQGFQGEKGNKGNIGSQGSMGQPGPGGARGVAGPQGPIGSQGASAVPGDACDLDIGTPTDGYLSDGLLPWEPTTKVCEAIDDVNEILLELAPDSPLSLEGVSLAMTGVSLFDGFASDKEYQNYKVGAGEDVDATYIGGKIIVADTFTLTNPTVGDRESGGDDTFYPGNEGILSSRITENGIEQERGSINLVTGSPSYDLSLTYKEVRKKMSNRPFSRSIWELIGYGFIEVRRFGRLERNCSIYGLSNRWRHLSEKPEVLNQIEKLLKEIERLKRERASRKKRMNIREFQNKILELGQRS